MTTFQESEVTEELEKAFNRIRVALPNLDPNYNNFGTLIQALNQMAQWAEEHNKTILYPNDTMHSSKDA